VLGEETEENQRDRNSTAGARQMGRYVIPAVKGKIAAKQTVGDIVIQRTSDDLWLCPIADPARIRGLDLVVTHRSAPCSLLQGFVFIHGEGDSSNSRLPS
jgi:hypothetical protein